MRLLVEDLARCFMIKQFLIKQALKYKAKDLPKEQLAMIEALVDKDPKLFETIAKEIEALKKAGKPDMYAALDVMKKYQKQIQALLTQK